MPQAVIEGCRAAGNQASIGQTRMMASDAECEHAPKHRPISTLSDQRTLSGVGFTASTLKVELKFRLGFAKIVKKSCDAGDIPRAKALGEAGGSICHSLAMCRERFPLLLGPTL